MDFVKGVDLSTLLELKRLGAKYYDNGEELDILTIARLYDIDTIRLRLWNDPYSPEGESYGAGGNDLATTLAIAKMATEAGFGVLLDIHYSDFWADPGKQNKPKAWEGYDLSELEKAVFQYTKAVLQHFKKQQINLTMVQIGNELSNGLLWPEGKVPQYDAMTKLLNAGISGARTVYQEIPLMLHLDNGGNKKLYREWFDHFMENGREFEIIGLSYYPFWHGTLDALEENMQELSVRYGKDMIVAEVSMGYTMQDYGAWENLPGTKRKGYATRPELVRNIEYPMTKQGQADFMQDFLNRLARIRDGKGKGFFYWEPAWIPVPGSGWATRASLAYLHDPGPCGNEWANQALFDYDGNTLPAWKVIRDFKMPEKI